MRQALTELAAEGEREHALVAAVYAQVNGRAATTPASGQIRAYAERALRDLDLPTPAKPSWFPSQSDHPKAPTRAQMNTLTAPEFRRRLCSVIDDALPHDDRQAYVREAFASATARDCGQFFNGRFEALCEEFGLVRLQYAAISLALMGINGSQGREDVIALYLNVDRKVMEDAVEKMMRNTDGSFSNYMILLDRWLQRPPSRWEAWADIVEVFGW
jgi:hypothetical protein